MSPATTICSPVCRRRSMHSRSTERPRGLPTRRSEFPGPSSRPDRSRRPFRNDDRSDQVGSGRSGSERVKSCVVVARQLPHVGRTFRSALFLRDPDVALENREHQGPRWLCRQSENDLGIRGYARAAGDWRGVGSRLREKRCRQQSRAGDRQHRVRFDAGAGLVITTKYARERGSKEGN